MPRSRLLSVCIAVSLALHIAATVVFLLLPQGKRPHPDFVPVELADMPRATDFLKPEPGAVQGAPPPPAPVPPSTAPRPPAPAPPPRASTPKAAPTPSAPKAAAPAGAPKGAPSATTSAPVAPEPPPQAQEKPAAGAASEKATPAAAEPVPSRGPAGNSPTPPRAAPKALKELLPRLGALVRAPGEPGGRREKPNKGSAVGTESKPKEKGLITEESGGGVHLSSLDSDDVQLLTYYDSLRFRLEQRWNPYEALSSIREGRQETFVEFTILRDGSLTNLKLVKSSGSRAMDDSVLRAIRSAAPFNKLPSYYPKPSLTIYLTGTISVEKGINLYR
ncbi:MAG TPA: TonB family protein [Candidatus Deferrimicrobiaceae bacterium]|jgi:TonB family protein